MRTIPYSRQWIDEDDIQAVVEVLHSDWITQGLVVEQFEKELAAYCGAKYAVAVSSGTAALHLACLAAGIKKDDEAITSPITFVASVNSVVYCGGTPVFADVNSRTINIDPKEIQGKINKKTKAIIPVHFTGLPCEMEKINKIAREYDLIVIEDACHALGAEYKVKDGKWVKVGSCCHSDMTVFSFHPVKHITTGEGGAITTNDPVLYEKLKMLRTHGITKNPDKFISENAAFTMNSNPWYYEMQELGFNYRITDFQCALGISQLKKSGNWLEIRRKIAKIYNDELAGINLLKLPYSSADLKSSHHLFVIRVSDRDRVFNQLRAAGIGVQLHYIPVYFHPFYRSLGYTGHLCPEAESYYEQTISLPIFPKMDKHDIYHVIKTIKRIIVKKGTVS